VKGGPFAAKVNIPRYQDPGREGRKKSKVRKRRTKAGNLEERRKRS